MTTHKVHLVRDGNRLALLRKSPLVVFPPFDVRKVACRPSFAAHGLSLHLADMAANANLLTGSASSE